MSMGHDRRALEETANTLSRLLSMLEPYAVKDEGAVQTLKRLLYQRERALASMRSYDDALAKHIEGLP